MEDPLFKPVSREVEAAMSKMAQTLPEVLDRVEWIIHTNPKMVDRIKVINALLTQQWGLPGRSLYSDDDFVDGLLYPLRETYREAPPELGSIPTIEELEKLTNVVAKFTKPHTDPITGKVRGPKKSETRG